MASGAAKRGEHLLQAGKAKAPAVIARAIAKPSKKKLKKMEQRARLLGGGKSKMEI